MVLLLLVLLLLLPGGCLTLKLGVSRAEALAMLGEQETRLYFHSCQMTSQDDSCVFAMDSSLSLEPSQCALTDPTDKHVWAGFLETPAYVTKVTVLSMDPAFKSFPDPLTNMEVRANNDSCGHHITTESTFTKWTFPCDAIADSILIAAILNNSVMAICDVEVFGVPLKFPTILGNRRQLRPNICQMSSVDGNGYCEHAFDGETNKNHQQKPCAVTNAEAEPWIVAQLAKPSYVLRVEIHGRSDCCEDSLTDFQITLDTLHFSEYSGPPAPVYLYFLNRRFGSRLEVKSRLSVALSVCEIQIFGHEAQLVEVPKFKPLGCHKDNMWDRDMSQLVSSIRMSHTKCHRMCKRLGLKHFAVQAGYHCFCGNSYGKHGVADNKTCSIKCDGEETEICGGEIQNSVFEIL